MSDLAAPARAHARAHPRLPAVTLRHAATMVRRCLRVSLRNVDGLLVALILPVMLMLMFVYLFGGAIDVGGGRYVTYVVPGVLLLCAGYGASMTAIAVSADMTSGIIDRFRALDVGGPALLAGHVGASVARNLVSTVLVLAAAFLIGFRPGGDLAAWAGAGGMLVLFILAMSWLSAAVGLVASSPEAASGFTFFVLFLPYPSSAFVPIETMPSWLQGFATNQPVTAVIETIRGLLVGTPLDGAPRRAVLWCALLLAVAIVLSDVLFRRRAR